MGKKGRTCALTKPKTSPFGLTGGPEGPAQSAAEAQGQGAAVAVAAAIEVVARKGSRRRYR